MSSKVMQLEAVKKYLTDGMSLAVGGQSINMNPVALVKETIKQQFKDLALIVSPVGGFAADLLIGSGAVKSLEFAQMSLWEFGLAPNMRRLSQEGRLVLKEHT